MADFICFGCDDRPDCRAERSDEKGDPGRRDRARRGEERSQNAGAVPASRIQRRSGNVAQREAFSAANGRPGQRDRRLSRRREQLVLGQPERPLFAFRDLRRARADRLRGRPLSDAGRPFGPCDYGSQHGRPRRGLLGVRMEASAPADRRAAAWISVLSPRTGKWPNSSARRRPIARRGTTIR